MLNKTPKLFFGRSNEALGTKDFRFRMRIARKEAKEARYGLRLLDTQQDQGLNNDRDLLIDESTELVKILSAIIEKSK
jgi:four helix bundle protein